MARSTLKALLLRSVRFVNQMSAWFERSSQSREELALEKEKDQNQVVLVPAKVLDCIEVTDLRGNGSRHLLTRRVFFRLLDANFRDIQQRHAPAALRQPNRVTAHSSSDIQRVPGASGEEVIVRAQQ